MYQMHVCIMFHFWRSSLWIVIEDFGCTCTV